MMKMTLIIKMMNIIMTNKGDQCDNDSNDNNDDDNDNNDNYRQKAHL